jgi:MoaA/NifB/PqqE/SkfB family radical SAM enzyme
MLKEIDLAMDYTWRTLKTALMRATWLPPDTDLPVEHLPKVIGVVFEVYDGCNSKCQSCNIWQVKPTKNLLTISEIKAIFSDTLFDHIEDVIITGGEPSIRDDLDELVLAIHTVRPKATISLSTNGLIPERVLKAVNLAMTNNLDLVVGVSLDAVGEEHDRLRGVPGNFRKVDYLLHELVSIGRKYPGKLRVTVGQTLYPESVDKVDELKAYVRKLGVNLMPQIYEEFTYYSNTEETRSALKFPIHIEGAVGHHLSDQSSDTSRYKKDPMSILRSFPPSPQNEIMLKALRTNKPIMRATKVSRNFCSSMNTFFLLRANGDITPCLRWSHIRMGNIRDVSPSEVWRSQAVRSGRKLVRECSGCSNTWATGWSAKYWFPQFFGVFLLALIKKKFTQRRRAESVSAPIGSVEKFAPPNGAN